MDKERKVNPFRPAHMDKERKVNPFRPAHMDKDRKVNPFRPAHRDMAYRMLFVCISVCVFRDTETRHKDTELRRHKDAELRRL